MSDYIDRNCTICGFEISTPILTTKNTGYRQCQECQAIFASPFPADCTEVNERSFEEALDRYASKIDSRITRYKKVLSPFKRYRQLNTFLEIGCNAGATLVAAEQLGWQATGVDISKAATQYARDKQNLNAITGTLAQANLAAESFDVVYSNAVMEHIEEPMETMHEAHRILRSGGVFFAATVNWESFTRMFLGENWRYLEPLHHVQLYTPANIREMAQRSNFMIERIWTTGVRLEDKKDGNHFRAPIALRCCKGLLSIATRFSHKGDSIKFILRKQ